MFNFGKKKIAVVGAGNAGCFTALHFLKYGAPDPVDIEIYYDPDTPIERVGQGTVLPPTELIGDVLGINWDNNPLDATIKTGFMYEGWGRKKEKIFSDFTLAHTACHYVPQKLSDVVLKSGKVKVIEKKIEDPEREIDSTFIFDCRGSKNRNKEDYRPLVNPLNSVLLCNKVGGDPSLCYTRGVATPNGWTFIIPNKDSLSYGYLYNNTITTREEAKEDFLERFNLSEVDGELEFENYVAKDIFVGERTVLNGNRAFFLEPLEATATDFYLTICKHMWDYITQLPTPIDKKQTNWSVGNVAKEVENFILWHYQFGSKYDSPFWNYAKSLPFNPDDKFKRMNKLPGDSQKKYGNWTPKFFKKWRENT